MLDDCSSVIGAFLASIDNVSFFKLAHKFNMFVSNTFDIGLECAENEAWIKNRALRRVVTHPFFLVEVAAVVVAVKERVSRRQYNISFNCRQLQSVGNEL